MSDDELRRLEALRLAIGAAENADYPEDTAATLDRAEAFDLFLKGWEANDGDAA